MWIFYGYTVFHMNGYAFTCRRVHCLNIINIFVLYQYSTKYIFSMLSCHALETEKVVTCILIFRDGSHTMKFTECSCLSLSWEKIASILFEMFIPVPSYQWIVPVGLDNWLGIFSTNPLLIMQFPCWSRGWKYTVYVLDKKSHVQM